MRVLLVGTAVDRARVRAELTTAGFMVVREAAVAPATVPVGIDAIVTAGRAASNGLEESEPRRDLEARAVFDGDDRTAVEPLTPREREVLALLADGLTNKGIASALGISDQTVKFHVATVIAKLGARNRTDAVRRAVRRGLVAI